MGRIDDVIEEANGKSNNVKTNKEGTVMNDEVSKVLSSLNVKEVDGDYVYNHSKEDLDMIKRRNSSLAALSGLTEQAAKAKLDLTTVSYAELVKAMASSKTEAQIVPVDFVKVGSNEPVNVVLSRLINTTMNTMNQTMIKSAAHLSVNVRPAVDDNDLAISDKSIKRSNKKLFTRSHSEIKNDCIISHENEGQIETTSILIDEDRFEELFLFIENLNRYCSVLSLNAADHIVEECRRRNNDPDFIRTVAFNQYILLNKGKIRKMVDNYVALAQPGTTAADRWESVNNIMYVVNDKLGTRATDSYVAEIELTEWLYSIFDPSSAAINNHATKKGRKYFTLPSGLALKIDMRGSKVGGKYPISEDYVDTFKEISGKFETNFLKVTENIVRSSLGLNILAVDWSFMDSLPEVPDMDIVEYIYDKLDAPNYDDDQNSADVFINTTIKEVLEEYKDTLNRTVLDNSNATM